MAYPAALAEWTRRIPADALLAKAEALTGLSDWGGRRRADQLANRFAAYRRRIT
jgi:hypothetical protein